MDRPNSSIPYAGLSVARPFLPIFVLIILVGFSCLFGLGWLAVRISPGDAKDYPLVTAFASVAAIGVATIGWGTASWVAHRNARVQHAINIIATRFSQQAFITQLTLFNNQFGDNRYPGVTTNMMNELAITKSLSDQQVYQSVKYILNYFEFIAVGIISGELDVAIVRKNLRGSMIHYFEKCRPYIDDLRRTSPTVLEHYARVVDHYRDPVPLP